MAKKMENIPLRSEDVERLVQEFLDAGGTIKKGPTLYADGAYKADIISTGKK